MVVFGGKDVRAPVGLWNHRCVLRALRRRQIRPLIGVVLWAPVGLDILKPVDDGSLNVKALGESVGSKLVASAGSNSGSRLSLDNLKPAMTVFSELSWIVVNRA